MRRFVLTFGAVALLVAGGLSYLADSDPDGLETVAHQGCTMAQTAGSQQLRGECMAQTADEHTLADGPFAGYTIGGGGTLTGVAGMLGVLATALLGMGLFWTLRKRPDVSSED